MKFTQTQNSDRLQARINHLITYVEAFRINLAFRVLSRHLLKCLLMTL